jgi:hypothetical protein
MISQHIVLFLLINSLLSAYCSPQGRNETVPLQPWQECSVFLAPSLSSSMGWGVFAGKSFEKDEIVDIAPLIFPMALSSRQVQNSVLDDYAYGYRRVHYNPQPYLEKLLGVFLGMTMFHNHHPTAHNLEYTTFGREPAHDVPNSSNAVGFRSRRFIQAGEELFSYYGEPGNNEWFTVRRIPLIVPETNKSLLLETDVARNYCSRMFSGIGRPTWDNRIMPMLPPRHVVGFYLNSSNLPPWDAGFGDARAKVDIAKGERIELAIGLVLSQKQLQGSILAPIAFAYQDLQPDHQQSLANLRQLDQLRLQYQGKDTDWQRIDLLDESLEDVAIFPAAGNIGMVRRVGAYETRNCRLVIPELESNDSAGVFLELIATQDITTGDVLLLNLPVGGTRAERQQLKKELQLTGMPYYDGLFDDKTQYAHTNNGDL